jgi:predicted secreted acid phosphatase
MVFVDFTNPYLREYLKTYGDEHRRRLDDIRTRLPVWVERAKKMEAGPASRPLAVVLDIDEVLLSNIHMNSFQGEQNDECVDFHAADYFVGPNGAPWPRGSRLNPLLPGVPELLEAIRALNLTIFLITGRLESIRDETVENFEVLGLFEKHFDRESFAQRLVMCPDTESIQRSVRPFKESRRREISRQYRIVLNVGDQVSDLGLYGDVQMHCAHPFYYTP